MVQTEIVNTKYGRLRGYQQASIEEFNYYAFKGIPYAKPPVGELRFQDPEPPEKWSDVRDALEFGDVCAQYDSLTQFQGGSEDCLYLNVYTKTLKPQLLLPVMVWIHGGGFVCGSGNDLFFGPDYLLRKDIVLVTINYRLGVFGFLNLEDEVAPGNQGLKDQVMALQYVKDNISNFGGDPNNVTIFGESAGGASVHYLTMSPLAKGLFHKAISQSGVALNPWASNSGGSPKEWILNLCEYLGKPLNNSKDIVKFLKTVDYQTLLDAQIKTGLRKGTYKRLVSKFSPGVDKCSPKPFLPIPLEMASEQGAHVPYLLGHTEREGTLLYKLLQSNDLNERNQDLASALNPNTLSMLRKYNLSPEELKYLYLKNENITEENIVKLIDLMSDVTFVLGIHKVIKTQVQESSAPTYMYQFTYDGVSFKKYVNADIPGATHMDELSYLFTMKDVKTETLEKGSQNYKVMERMVELWTNFAKTGNPTPTLSEVVPLYWKPVTDGTVLRYLNIGDDLRVEKVLNVEERFSYKNN